MKWVKKDDFLKIPIKSWCDELEEDALMQALNLANHPIVTSHVALMPDCHVGYGMPIGGVIACDKGVIPNAVGVDIGCGMGAVETDFMIAADTDKKKIREILEFIKQKIPLREGKSHKTKREWNGFTEYLKSIGINKELEFNEDEKLPGWLDQHTWDLAYYNLGSLGGGNHFIEMQKDDKGMLWLMLHSGSRNLGYRIASYYNKEALKLNKQYCTDLPSDELAFLPADSFMAKSYIRDMNFALSYAMENRKRMMEVFKDAVSIFLKDVSFISETNIHHNYASLENHFGKNVWVHRKGATRARLDERGIIPGSMGTSSYIVRGLGNPDSFNSCSHGAGRRLGRNQACRNLNIDECNKAMEGIVFDRWSKLPGKTRKKNKDMEWDLSEAPFAYKDIETVIESQLDLIEPLVKLKPIGVLKG